LKFSPDGVLFHVEHYAEALVFLPPREDRPSDPESKTRDNADCATEFLPEAAGFILRMFQPHVQRPREVGVMFRSSCLNRKKHAGIGRFISFKTARPNADSFTQKIQPQIPHNTSFRNA